MKTSESIKALAPALLQAKKQMTAVGKGGYNQHDSYSYAQLADYMDVVRPALEDAGLVLITSAPSITPIEGRQTANGKPQYACYVTLTLRVLHAETGEWSEVTSQGEGQDRADKAVYKAITGARKYGVAMLFDLVTTDDPEHETDGRQSSPPNNSPSKPSQNAADFI